MPDSNTRQRRNWAARAAIMRKGGVHEKTHKAKRQQDKQNLKKKLRADSFGSFSSVFLLFLSQQRKWFRMGFLFLYSALI